MVFHGTEQADAGVVYEDVDLTGLGPDALEVGLDRDIRRDGVGPDTQRASLLRGPIQLVTHVGRRGPGRRRPPRGPMPCGGRVRHHRP